MSEMSFSVRVRSLSPSCPQPSCRCNGCSFGPCFRALRPRYRLVPKKPFGIDRVMIRQDMHKLPMEDFCQLSSRLTEEEYKGSYGQCGKLINTFSSQNMLDITNFWHLPEFCFITANSRMHWKNLSLYAPDGRHYHLTPAYDLLPASLILPEDKEESALSLGGRHSMLNRLDFLRLAQHLNLSPKVGEIHRLLALEDVFIGISAQAILPERRNKHLRP